MRRSGYMWVSLLLASACARSAFELPERVEFADAALGEERISTFRIRNTSKVDELVELSATADFRISSADQSAGAIERAKLELKAGTEAEVVVFFKPTELGPREGVLAVRSVHSEARAVQLFGRAVGPALEAPQRVGLPTLALLAGQSAGQSRGVLRLRNTGTLNSLLNLELPESSSPELCVGEFIGDACVRWIPSSISAGEFVEAPLTARVTDASPRSWLVTLRSNDVRTPTRTVNVQLGVAQVAPCQFDTAPELTLSESIGFAFITHTGAQQCLVESMELQASPPDTLEFISPVPLPRLLQPGESLSQTLRIKPPLNFIEGKLIVRAAGTPPLEITLRPADGANPCVVVTPGALDFGTSRQTCASAVKFVSVYNVCANPIQLARASVVGDDFFVTSANVGTDIVRGGPPALVSVRFRPSAIGPRTAMLSLSTTPFTYRLVELRGIGDGPAFQTDTFRQDLLPRADLAFIVDTSPSFAAQRSAVRAQVATVLQSVGCADVNVAFAPAEGAGPVAFSANDAGDTWTSSQQPGFVARALSSFDALPASSETEACIGVAERLAGRARANTQFSGFCITDALEQTPDAGGALASLRAQVASLNWSVVTGLPASSCAVEARDDDQTHRSLATFGQVADVCRSDWAFDFVTASTHDCGVRTSFFLNGLALPPIEVRIDGQVVSTGWVYEPANNAIQFDPTSAPQPGSTLEVSYATSCTP